VLSAIALIPSAPVMVPELATGAAPELRDLSSAALDAVGVLPERWFVIGVGAADNVIGPGAVGTFGGYGADIRVALSPNAAGEPKRLPLCALIAGWVRAKAAPRARGEVWVYDADHGVDAALARGKALRAEVDAISEAVGVLVVADGANTLTPSAPGGYDPDSAPVQAALDDALASGDATALTRLPDGISGRVAYQVLAGLTGPSPSSAREFYRGAPYGVGYFVGVWTPAPGLGVPPLAGGSEATGGSAE
jgi:hypothetical protein